MVNPYQYHKYRAFAKMKKGDVEFWNLMVNHTLLKWEDFHVHDLEMMLNAYRTSLFSESFTPQLI